ncbi:MAG: hypothetical protein ACSHXZ_12985 [Gammaproteobacteria bacterium]
MNFSSGIKSGYDNEFTTWRDRLGVKKIREEAIREEFNQDILALINTEEMESMLNNG